MKTLPLALAAWLAGAAMAAAQEPSRAPLSRGDVHFVLGWQNLHKAQQPEDRYSNDWINGIFFGGAGAGWYWTDNLKAQVDIGGGTRGHQYRFVPIVVGGVSTGAQSSRLTVQRQSVAVSQQYQFFRNQWFHPHVGAGVDLARETTREEHDPVFFFDPITRVSRQVSPALTEGPDHRFIARPFAEAGFKAYMTRRAFFTSDARLIFKSGVDEVLFRLGFGVDF
jgi:opacity protein-like surface antigen